MITTPLDDSSYMKPRQEEYPNPIVAENLLPCSSHTHTHTYFSHPQLIIAVSSSSYTLPSHTTHAAAASVDERCATTTGQYGRPTTGIADSSKHPEGTGYRLGCRRCTELALPKYATPTISPAFRRYTLPWLRSDLSWRSKEHILIIFAAENEIAGDVLVHLDHDALKDLEVTSVGHRLYLLKQIYNLKIAHGIKFEKDDYVPICKSFVSQARLN